MADNARTDLTEDPISHSMAEDTTGINDIQTGSLRNVLKGRFSANGKGFIDVEAVDAVKAKGVYALENGTEINNEGSGYRSDRSVHCDP